MLISVVTAVRNRCATIAETLRSVAGQRHSDVEHLVIDGQSTDGTCDVIKRHLRQGVVFVSEPDTGIYNALNKGVGRSSGDVIGFLHADDLFASADVLSKVAEAFRDSSIEAVYGDLVYVSQADVGKVVRYWRAGNFSRRALTQGWMPPHPTLYVRRAVYSRIGGFDETYRIAADYDSVLKIFGRDDVRCAYIPEVLVKMRLGGVSNRSLPNIFRKSLEDYRALRANRIGGLATLLAKNTSKIKQFVASR